MIKLRHIISNLIFVFAGSVLYQIQPIISGEALEIHTVLYWDFLKGILSSKYGNILLSGHSNVINLI